MAQIWTAVRLSGETQQGDAASLGQDMGTAREFASTLLLAPFGWSMLSMTRGCAASMSGLDPMDDRMASLAS